MPGENNSDPNTICPDKCKQVWKNTAFQEKFNLTGEETEFVFATSRISKDGCLGGHGSAKTVVWVEDIRQMLNGVECENSTETIIFMSMFNNIDWHGKVF